MEDRPIDLVKLGPWLPALLAACASTPEADRPRDRDEVVVCGRRFHTGTPVVLFSDPDGLDATGSGHYSVRKGWQSAAGDELEHLRDLVSQVVIHYDVAGTSKRCFKVLEKRKLSCHFLIDLDGTVYQTLDLKERAWHAGEANDRSIGIEMANIGAYRDPTKLTHWYGRDAGGLVYAKVPDGYFAASNFVPRPARPGLITGKIHGTTLHQRDFTAEQYEALARLLATLVDVLPAIPLESPPSRTVLAVPDSPGVVAHYHLSRSKIDPGPAFDWARVLQRTREHLK